MGARDDDKSRSAERPGARSSPRRQDVSPRQHSAAALDPWASSSTALTQLESRLKKSQKSPMSEMHGFMAEQMEKYQAESQASFNDVIEAARRRLEGHDRDINELRRRQEDMERSSQSMLQSIATVEKILASAEAQAPVLDVQSLANFDRPVDPTIFTTWAASAISPAEIRRCLLPWVAAAGLEPDAITVVGDAPGRKFILQVARGKEIALPRASALTRALRTSTGWRTCEAANVQGVPAAVYNADESPKQFRTRIQTKRLQQILQQQHDGIAWSSHGAKGLIFADSQPMVELVVDGPGSATRVKWNPTILAKHPAIVKADILASFSAMFEAVDTSSWCS